MLRLPLALAALVLRALRSPLSFLGWSLASFWPRLRLVLRGSGPSRGPTPTSVNYHFTRRCNYKCGFCFHTAKTSFELPLEEAQRGLAMLRAAGERGTRGDRDAPGRGADESILALHLPRGGPACARLGFAGCSCGLARAGFGTSGAGQALGDQPKGCAGCQPGRTQGGVLPTPWIPFPHKV